ncbi:MFS transporter [Streptomyces yangpuensis]|uniref:MFS transporter n=1 Tax=Streptomyces yangpuensis TaxID=1648182 RepID=UPI00382517E8
MTRRRAAGGRHARIPNIGIVRRIYLPRCADAVSFSMATYAIPLLVLATTGSAALTGIAFTLEWVPRLAAFSWAGAAVDRWGCTRVFRMAATLRALVLLAAVAALTLVDDGLPATIAVMALAAVTGVLTEYSYVAAETAGALAGRKAGEGEHKIQSVLLGIDNTANLTGPAAGGLLLQYAGRTGMLLTIAGLSLLAAFLAPRDRLHRTAEVSASPMQGLRVGWATLRSLPALAWLITGLTVSNIATGTLQAAAPVLIVQQMGHTSASVGLIWSAAAAASLLAVAICRFAIDRAGLWPVGAVCAAIAAASGFAVAQAEAYTQLLVLVAVLMAGEGGMTVVLRTLRSKLIPEAVFGSTLAVTILIMLLPFPVAGLLVALTPANLLGQVLTVCAALQAVGLVAAFWRMRRDPALATRVAFSQAA